MDAVAVGAFWICLGLVLYSLCGYPLLLLAAYVISQIRRDLNYLGDRRERRVAPAGNDSLPAVSLIVAVYNEEACLENKLANARALDYPRDRLETVIVSDGSTDRTNAILAETQRDARAVVLDKRSGKANALNEGVARSRGEILVFSDASTVLDRDAVRNLVRHFHDPSVGVVCGAVRLAGNREAQQTEGFYWKLERILHLMEARLGATLSASGALYAVRRSAYVPLARTTLVDDLVVPMRARQMGYRVAYDPEAGALDFAAPSVASEFRRRVRLAAGSFRALPDLLRIPMPGFTRVAFFSHKLLRWAMPFVLLGLLLSNALLLAKPGYQMALLGQLLLYGWAVLGAVVRKGFQRIPYARTAYFMLAMMAAFLIGFLRCLRDRHSTSWQKAH